MARHLEVGHILVYFPFLEDKIECLPSKVPGQVDEHCLYGLLDALTLH